MSTLVPLDVSLWVLFFLLWLRFSYRASFKLLLISVGSFFSLLVLFSLLWLRSLYLGSFLLFRILVIFNAEGLSIDFDFFERDSVRRLLYYYHASSRPITRLLYRA